MAHPKDDQLIPIDTVVKIKTGPNAGKKARIKKHSFLMDGKGFLNYLGYIQGKGKDLYALYHDDLEVIPNE
jgi:hypothetical protein